MTIRDKQREDTRERIIAAAALAFAEFGFRGASTREIAQRANANQGLITYHFKTKDDLWRAAADRIFTMLRTRLGERVASLDSGDPREFSREVIREYVRFAAAHPELFRLMLDEGKGNEARMRWLVDTHLKPLYASFCRFGDRRSTDDGGGEGVMHPHAFYVLAGAGSVIFVVAPECRRLTGLDPRSRKVVEAHADFVAKLLVP